MTEEKKQLTENQDSFIMHPTVDFCFKELMENAKVRQGLIAAILQKDFQKGDRVTISFDANNFKERISGR